MITTAIWLSYMGISCRFAFDSDRPTRVFGGVLLLAAAILATIAVNS